MEATNALARNVVYRALAADGVAPTVLRLVCMCVCVCVCVCSFKSRACFIRDYEFLSFFFLSSPSRDFSLSQKFSRMPLELFLLLEKFLKSLRHFSRIFSR